MGHSHRTTQAMPEEQLKAADTDAALEKDFAELSDEEQAGVSGGGYSISGSNKFKSMEAAAKIRSDSTIN